MKPSPFNKWANDGIRPVAIKTITASCLKILQNLRNFSFRFTSQGNSNKMDRWRWKDGKGSRKGI